MVFVLANECKPGLKPWFSELKPWIAMVVSCIFLLILLSSIFLAPEEAVDSSVTQLLFTHLPSHQPFWCQDALKFSANTANHTVRTSCVDSPTGLFRAWDTNFLNWIYHDISNFHTKWSLSFLLFVGCPPSSQSGFIHGLTATWHHHALPSVIRNDERTEISWPGMSEITCLVLIYGSVYFIGNMDIHDLPFFSGFKGEKHHYINHICVKLSKTCGFFSSHESWVMDIDFGTLVNSKMAVAHRCSSPQIL